MAQDGPRQLPTETTPAPLPEARGPVSSWVLGRLRGRPTIAATPALDGDALDDDDLHLALHCLYELGYRAFEGVDEAKERDPLLLGCRFELEDAFLDAVRAELARTDGDRWAELARSEGPGAAVDALLADFDGPSLSRFVEEHGTRGQFREFMIHRSAYQLKEADPHTVGLARLQPGRRKSAYAEIQFDEYGSGEPGATHAELFAAALRDAGLDSAYGRWIDLLPGATLATGNLLSLFASRRELLGPLVGHLATFEMTSVVPMGRYARAAERLEMGAAVQRFFDVHVEADAHHGRLAREQLLGGRSDHAGLDPAEVVFGAQALVRIEDRFARNLLDAWQQGISALRPDGGGAVARVPPMHA